MEPVTSIILGATVLTVIGIMFGGTFLLRISTHGIPFNDLQKRFFRAGHAHAGVLVTLGLVCALLQWATGVSVAWQWAAVGVLTSALLIPGGFFLSVLGTEPQRPGRAINLLWAGVALLALSLATVGVSVIIAGVTRLA
ncbi:MAG: hypothetical protein ACTHZ9_09005 [Leucobacter sp.]